MPLTTETFCPKNQQEWRNWLSENHKSKDGIWLIVYTKGSDTTNLTWSQSVDEALCFGWIDGTKRPLDKDRYQQYFTKRKPKSNWSRINKVKVEKLTKSGLMRKAGFQSIEIAKENGFWTILDSVENLEIPADLEIAFEEFPGAKDFFIGMSKSMQKQMLYWVISAKRPETRKKRIYEIVVCASQRKKPKQF
jgi:uncharacterized protein YdeI (YjbR/CyaY-like superfamily)